MRTQFWEYIRTTIAVQDWDNLTTLLQCSPHRLTKLKNGNQDFSIAEIEALAQLTGNDPVALAGRFELGYTTNTIAAMQAFASRHGQTLHVQVNAA